MASKDLKPKQRLGKSHPGRVKAFTWTFAILVFAGGGFAAYRYTGTTEIEVPVARVRRADFIVSGRTRGDIKSAHSTILKAPQVPGLRITHLAANGQPIGKGDVAVEFDAVGQEQLVISRTTQVQSADGDIVQLKATQKMDQEADAMNKMTAEYALERAKLDASKAEVLSAIDGEKNRLDVGVSEGALQQVKATINSHQVGNEADLGRLGQRKDKAVRDLDTAKK
jgi:HlyD family secretion protein